MKFNLFIFIMMVSTTVIHAEARICFSNWSEYTAIRSQLPPHLQSHGEPLSFQFGKPAGNRAAGIMQIQREGNQLRLNSVVRHLLVGTQEDSTVVRMACYENGRLQVQLTNGASERLTITQRGIEVRGYELLPIRPQQFISARAGFPGLRPHQTPAIVVSSRGGS